MSELILLLLPKLAAADVADEFQVRQTAGQIGTLSNVRQHRRPKTNERRICGARQALNELPARCGKFSYNCF